VAEPGIEMSRGEQTKSKFFWTQELVYSTKYMVIDHQFANLMKYNMKKQKKMTFRLLTRTPGTWKGQLGCHHMMSISKKCLQDVTKL
jgi:hypothetical protein